MIAIIDVSGANLTSLANAVQRLGYEPVLTHAEHEIRAASHVLLPGVGTAQFAMNALKNANIVPLIQSITQPLLGICLGMQLLFDGSDEGNVACLGLIPGRVQKIATDQPVPHMGWNQLQWQKQSALQTGLNPQDYVYFVHSYAVKNSPYCVAECNYGETFAAIVQKDNIFGMQFHPEKSGAIGMCLLDNFLEM